MFLNDVAFKLYNKSRNNLFGCDNFFKSFKIVRIFDISAQFMD